MRQAFYESVPHVSGQILIWEIRRHMLRKRGTRFNRELITGEMRCTGCSSLVHLLKKTLNCFARQCEHQIKIEILKNAACFANGATGFIRRVNAAEPLQTFVAEALDADRQPINAGISEIGKFTRVRGAWIRFKRYFAVGSQRKLLGNAVEQRTHSFSRHQTWSPAADKYRCDGTHLFKRLPMRQISQQCGYIPHFIVVIREPSGIEIAIWTFANAPRPMQINRKRNSAGRQ